jgi:hypothetical protein
VVYTMKMRKYCIGSDTFCVNSREAEAIFLSSYIHFPLQTVLRTDNQYVRWVTQ